MSALIYEIAPGVEVLLEKAYAEVVVQEWQRKVCSVCLKQSVDPDLGCDDCGQVSYCSESCVEAFAPLHKLECEALEEVDRISSKYQSDTDLCRLLIRIVVQRHYENPSNNTTTSSLFQDVLKMTHVVDQLDTKWKESISASASELSKYFPFSTSDDDTVTLMVELAARVNENSHMLGFRNDPSQRVSVGIYPNASLFNHSCVPNCAFSKSPSSSSSLQIRTLRPIRPNEELCVSYINLTLPKAERQQLLLETKHFKCTCPRCSTELLQGSTTEQRELNSIVELEAWLNTYDDIRDLDHYNVYTNLTKLSTLYKRQGQYSSALTVYKKLLECVKEFTTTTDDIIASPYAVEALYNILDMMRRIEKSTGKAHSELMSFTNKYEEMRKVVYDY